jgi:diguanylate cyclase (GGDEF)-like protein
LSGLRDEATALLATAGICADLDAEELSRVSVLLTAVDIRAGSWLFRQGDPGDRLYLVGTGRVSILVERTDGELMPLASFERGSFFGEMSIIDGEPRSAGCRAEVDSTLFALSRRKFFTLKREHPRSAYKIMRRMLLDAKARLSNTNGFLSELVQWGEEASRRAITDELTGLYNRRHLDSVLPSLVEAARSESKPLSLVMVDLDHFGSINEHYSQAKGDVVIKAVVEVFKSALRDRDIAARYGGDEFNILLPDTDEHDALYICNRICENVSALDVLHDAGGPITQVTTSQGVATFPENGDSAEALREAADAALYAAKEAGRNRVQHASGVK